MGEPATTELQGGEARPIANTDARTFAELDLENQIGAIEATLKSSRTKFVPIEINLLDHSLYHYPKCRISRIRYGPSHV